MNILIVGFGNMGCRHAQAFLNIKSFNIFVVEPDNETFNKNLIRISAKSDQIERTTLETIKNFKIDLAVIATSAEVRFEIFHKLVNSSVKKIILEKIVFQSNSQFDDAIKLVAKKNIDVYCNFINRYSNSYTKIKNLYSENNNVTMSVTGGHFGFACNALHYIDIFEYITNKKAILKYSKLTKSDLPNPRGKKYVEVFGYQLWKTKDGDQLFISSDINNSSGKGSENHIKIGSSTFIINENTLLQFNITQNEQIKVDMFDMPMASTLTLNYYNQIIDQSIRLPTLVETMGYHIQFFKSINETIDNSNQNLCPIT